MAIGTSAIQDEGIKLRDGPAPRGPRTRWIVLLTGRIIFHAPNRCILKSRIVAVDNGRIFRTRGCWSVHWWWITIIQQSCPPAGGLPACLLVIGWGIWYEHDGTNGSSYRSRKYHLDTNR